MVEEESCKLYTCTYNDFAIIAGFISLVHLGMP